MTDYTASDWSQQDAGNTSASPNGLSGANPPSNISPVIRAIRGAAKRSFDRSNAMVTTTGTANALIVTYLVSPTAYVKGEKFSVWAHATNTGPVTININSLGAKQLLSQRGQPMIAGQIVAGDLIEFAYDGTSFALIAEEYAVDEVALFKNAIEVGSLYHDTTAVGLRKLNANTGAVEGNLRVLGGGVNDLRFNDQIVFHAGNDGSGSMLDSDLLDGQHGTYYRDLANATGTLNNARLTGDYSFNALTLDGALSVSGIENKAGVGYRIRSSSNVLNGSLYHDGTNLVLRRYNTTTGAGEGYIRITGNGAESLEYNGNTIWHRGNDGSGSDLDADLLDGQHGTYYRDLGNSTGTLPNARLVGNYDFTSLTTAGVSAINNNLAVRYGICLSRSAASISDIDASAQAYLGVSTTGTVYLSRRTTAGGSDTASVSLIADNADGLRFTYGSTNTTVFNSGNLLDIGTSASSARSALGLGGLATENFSSLVYSGSSASNTNFPIGTCIGVRTSGYARNEAATIRISSSSDGYTVGGSTAALTGTWRARGTSASSDDNAMIFQRTA